MNKEEYIQFVEKNEDLSRVLELSSSINAILEILINKNICSIEEFKEIKEKYREDMLERSYARETQEDLKAAKTITEFMDMIGVK